jgi:hypothetical protein
MQCLRNAFRNWARKSEGQDRLDDTGEDVDQSHLIQDSDQWLAFWKQMDLRVL